MEDFVSAWVVSSLTVRPFERRLDITVGDEKLGEAKCVLSVCFLLCQEVSVA